MQHATPLINLRRELLTIVVAVGVIVASACGGATATGPSLATQTAPPSNGAVAYDQARKVAVLVTTGVAQTAKVMETWTWNGTLWTRQVPKISPPIRSYGLLAYDESRRVTVLQGGMSRNQTLTDTWEWDGANWSERRPAHSPSSVQQPGSLAYDPTTHRTLLYQWQQQTWSWDGQDWNLLQPTHVPNPWSGVLVFDGKRLILLGLGPSNGTDTWGWNGSDWTLLVAGRVPGASLPAAFDGSNGKVVTFGGGPGDDTWTWDGTTWSRAHPKHSPNGSPQHLFYDSALKQVIGFAGTDQLISGIYGWNGLDWSAIGSGTPLALVAGKDLVSATDAMSMIRRTVATTHPVLLPRMPAGVDQAQVTADTNGFSLMVMNDDRSIQVSIAIVVPGNSNGAAANRDIMFRGGPAYYQYIVSDASGFRDLWWTERPGHWMGNPGLKSPDGVPYALASTGLNEAEFFALASSLS